MGRRCGRLPVRSRAFRRRGVSADRRRLGGSRRAKSRGRFACRWLVQYSVSVLNRRKNPAPAAVGRCEPPGRRRSSRVATRANLYCGCRRSATPLSSARERPKFFGDRRACLVRWARRGTGEGASQFPTARVRAKAPSPLRSAGAVQKRRRSCFFVRSSAFRRCGGSSDRRRLGGSRRAKSRGRFACRWLVQYSVSVLNRRKNPAPSADGRCEPPGRRRSYRVAARAENADAGPPKGGTPNGDRAA